MSIANIKFEEEQGYEPITASERNPLFIRLILSSQIVATKKQALLVLFGVAVSVLLLTFFIFRSATHGPVSPPPANRIIYVAGPGAVPGKK